MSGTGGDSGPGSLAPAHAGPTACPLCDASVDHNKSNCLLAPKIKSDILRIQLPSEIREWALICPVRLESSYCFCHPIFKALSVSRQRRSLSAALPSGICKKKITFRLVSALPGRFHSEVDCPNYMCSNCVQPFRPVAGHLATKK